MDQSTPPKANWYVRTLILIFCLLLIAMVAYRFLLIDPRGEISAGVVTLLCLLLILVLAESFDSFSIGKLISVSREAKKKEKEVEKLEKQNAQLLSQLISISNTQSQNQSHTNVYGDYHAAPSVRRASEEELRDKKSADAMSIQQPIEPVRTRINLARVEEIGLKKYLQMRSVHPSNVIVDAKMTDQFQGVDPVSNQQIIFDGYLKEQDHEIFVEFRPATSVGPLFRDRLYVMISKINHYRNAKRVEAHLDLVLVKIPGEEARSSISSNRMLEYFEPAIASGLLKILLIELTEQEAASCRESQ
ncbi:hypothetical protein [Paracidovorax oryzae]|uniref:hypothetical protein n=1 Tax=Paracidovorax oryzae TaxID=862720 RepID=UPI0012FF472B|nr:hypothetical protein [Paracidovorax oryzae]